MTERWEGLTLGSVREAPSWNLPCGDPSAWQALPDRFVLPSPGGYHHFRTSSVAGSENYPYPRVKGTGTMSLHVIRTSAIH